MHTEPDTLAEITRLGARNQIGFKYVCLLQELWQYKTVIKSKLILVIAMV